MMAAKLPPAMYMKMAGLAPSIISLAAQTTDGEAPRPPRLSGSDSRCHSPSMIAW